VEAVLFIGIPGSGKSSFYRDRFFDTHVRISLDQLGSRHRERTLVETCLALGQPFVVDSANATAKDRARYVAAARQAGFRVVAYYFRSSIAEALARSARRSGKGRVPDREIIGTHVRLELPDPAEGFDAVFHVRQLGESRFEVEPLKGDT
jgi:predicted kinase